MFKKRISLMMALVMVLTLFVGIMPMAEASPEFVDNGYKIIDSAYGNGTYVVMAKDSGYTGAKIYVSKDLKTWTLSKTEAQTTNYYAGNDSQELVWWDAEQKFVAGIGGKVYLSDDALTWVENAELSTGSNAVVSTNGSILVVASYGKVMVARSLSDIQYAYNVVKGYYPVAIAIVSDNEVIISGNDRADTITYAEREVTIDGSEEKELKYTWAVVGTAWSMGIIARDTKKSGSDKWIVLNSNGAGISILSTNRSFNPKKFAPFVAEDEQLDTGSTLITAIGADDDNYFFGTDKGAIYTISRTSAVNQDVWTPVLPKAGGTIINSEITGITNINNNSFLLTTEKSAYIMEKTQNGYSYYDPSVYKTIEEAKAYTEVPFANGIKILGGAYGAVSEDDAVVDTYVVYGNDADGKGHIYYSNNGIDWNTTGVGTSTLTTGANDGSAKNQIVWWPAQNMFVLNNATNALNGSAWYSHNGKSWSYNTTSGLGNNGDICIVGDTLYSANYGSQRAIKKYTSFPSVPTSVLFSEANKSYNLNTIAVSDDEKYILAATGWGQAFVGQAFLLGEEEPMSPMLITPGGGTGDSVLMDAHWNNNIGRFVAINKISKAVYLIPTDSNVVTTVPTGAADSLRAVLTNGVNYIVGDNSGNLYVADTTNLTSTTSFEKIEAGNGTENTLPVTNIFVGAEGKYYVTVSDGEASDILIVNADGASYEKLSELTMLKSVKAGDKFTVSVKEENYTGLDDSFEMIVAIYNSDYSKLLQLETESMEMEAQSEGYLTMDVIANEDIPNDAKVKVFLWDSLNGMVPITNAKSFF